MYRLDTKLAKIRAGKYAPGDFIIADAKDGDMSNPIPGTGPIRNEKGQQVRFRTRREFLDVIAEIVRQDELDIMLVSASNLELLTEAGVFKNSAVKPAFRGNDTSDIWGARPNGYGKLGPSRPFRTRGPEGHCQGEADRPGALLGHFRQRSRGRSEVSGSLRGIPRRCRGERHQILPRGVQSQRRVGHPAGNDRPVRQRLSGAVAVGRPQGEAAAIPEVPV